MSDNFRDLERPDAAHRKDQVLMAAISGLECLDHPTRQDLARFSRLFMPLYAAAGPDVRRTASAALSRLNRLPDDVADMLVNEPIAIAAPFIAHYPLLKESTLARAVARKGAPHARAAARRSDLSPQAIATLRSLNDPSVEGLLILRGLIPDPAKAPLADPAARPRATPPATPLATPQATPHATPNAIPQEKTRPVVEAPPLDPSERLRATLRALALRSPLNDPAPQQTAIEAPRPKRPLPTVGQRAPAQPLNRPVSARAAPTTEPQRAPAAARPAGQNTEVRLGQLARYAKPDQASWFATALADAMGASYALAERIMMDVSGRQLATALIALDAPESTIRAALESFFPHLSRPSARKTLATDLIEALDRDSCTARLDAWQRADRYTHGGAPHVPALADSKDVRREPFQKVARPETRRGARKTG
ncbi:hypothetical protein [Hoeflea sp.]|uniref:hypothetical protein n=1 Tax=Hoeflea sp. TaxID=1940281 RepID=UPI0019C7C0FA|nr:hypothetical protein [Hoeflea sp.]MBC7281128.1 hypothetical protein [Hoeflea sp.]